MSFHCCYCYFLDVIGDASVDVVNDLTTMPHVADDDNERSVLLLIEMQSYT
jgi:hypothetical protein